MKFRTEFAIDNVWYTNALRFNHASDAVTEAKARFDRWTLPSAWRVVTDDVPQKQPFSGRLDITSFKVTDANEEQVP